MRTIDKVTRREWTDLEKEQLIKLWISNWVGWAWWVKFTKLIREILDVVWVYMPWVDISKLMSYLDDLDRLANEWHDPDYYEWNTLLERLLADYRFAKWVFFLTHWTNLWIRILLFLVILIWLWKNWGKYYNYWKKKYIKLIISNNEHIR